MPRFNKQPILPLGFTPFGDLIGLYGPTAKALFSTTTSSVTSPVAESLGDWHESRSKLNGTGFSSSAVDQVSTWYREQKHSLFTYFFLKGIRGEADDNGDSAITIQELENYLTDPTDGVPYWARRLMSREQTPVVTASDKNEVLVELK